MSRDEYVSKNIRNLDPDVRHAVVSEALARSVTISDVVGSAISEAWDMVYEPSGSRPIGVETTGTQFVVRLPQDMATRIWLVSRSRGITEGSVVQELLADRYDIPYSPVKRGGETRRRKKVGSG